MTAYSELGIYDRFVDIRQNQMENDKAPSLAMMELIVEYLRLDITVSKESRGLAAGESIIEGTGHFDLATMATWFIGNLVGPTLDWIRYRMRERRLKGDDVFNAFLQRLAEFMLEDVYSWPNSNFYEINQLFVLDGLSVGSPCLLIEQDNKTMRKSCILPHYSENYLLRDFFGNDIGYHRRQKLTNLAAMQAFGKENLPASIQQDLNNGNHSTEHEYLLCIARAGDVIFQDLKEPLPMWTPWVKLWFALGSVQPAEKKPLNWNKRQSDNRWLPVSAPGYWYRPFNSWHYRRNSWETYSRTPAWYGLPDVKGLNAAWRTIHEVAHKYARPPHYALDSLKGKLRLGADGVTWLDPVQYDRPPKPIGDSSNYPWAMDFIDRRVRSVGRHFFADMSRMIENYSREHKQPPTAYQLAQMISETLVLIGPAITSYAGPALHNIDEQFMELELNDPSGRIYSQTEPPDELYETNGEVAAVFTGPLIQGLRQAMQNKRIMQPLLMAEGVFQLWPDARHKVRADVVTEHILEGGDFPQDSIVSQEEYGQIQQAIQEERRQASMLEKMSVAADIVPKLQKQSEKGSPIKALGGAV